MRDFILPDTTWWVFIGFTVIVMGSLAALMGRAVAQAWRPARRTLPYAVVLGLFDRFVVSGLFGGSLLSVGSFIVDEYVILFAALIAYRATLAAQMARQYPWLYERVLIFGWRNRAQ